LAVHVRTDECNERVSRRLQFKPGIAACHQASGAHLLQLTVDRSSSRCHDDARALRWRPYTRRADTWSPGAPGPGALSSPPGCRSHRRRYCRRYRPTAAPRRAGHTPVHGLGSSRAPLRAASARARMHLLQAADRMHTPSKDLLPFRRALPAACAPGAVGRCRARTRRQTGRGRLSMMNPSPVVNTSPNTSGIQAIRSASRCRRRWKRETPIRPDR